MNNIPLTEDEAIMLQKAAATLGKAHYTLANFLVSVRSTGDALDVPTMKGVHISLASLAADRDMMHRIVVEDGERKFLTPDGVGNILALEDTQTGTFNDLKRKIMDEMIEQRPGGPDLQALASYRHDGLEQLASAKKKMQMVFEMLNSKLQVLGNVSQEPGREKM